MKPQDGAFVVRKLRRDMVSPAVLDFSTGTVHLEPMQRERWQSHLDSLEVLAETLENNPAVLCSERQLIDAALASEAVQSAMLEQLTTDALRAELERRDEALGYFSYDGEYWEEYETAAEARDACERALDDARDVAGSDGWPDTTESICWGRVLERVVETSRQTAADFEDPEEASSALRGFDYIATFELKGAEPATETT